MSPPVGVLFENSRSGWSCARVKTTAPTTIPNVIQPSMVTAASRRREPLDPSGRRARRARRRAPRPARSAVREAPEASAREGRSCGVGHDSPSSALTCSHHTIGREQSLLQEQDRDRHGVEAHVGEDRGPEAPVAVDEAGRRRARTAPGPAAGGVGSGPAPKNSALSHSPQPLPTAGRGPPSGSPGRTAPRRSARRSRPGAPARRRPRRWRGR